ncbi:GntR family transcriptional regulator [Vagococcus allomyrinae]|nr:GntR family transcriptional regulator [Vagococcus allomyrinae]
MSIRTNSDLPLYAQIANELRANIQTEKWQEGDRIPTEFELCEIYHVSRITIRKAIEELVRENLLYRERSKGTFVQQMTVESNDHSTVIKSFTKELQERGKMARTVMATIDISHADKRLAKFMNVQVGEKILVLKRTRGDEDSTFAYFITYFTFNKEYSLDYRKYKESFYEYLKEHGVAISEEREYVEAVKPNLEIQKALKIKADEAVLKRVRFTQDQSSDFYEYSECYYIGSKYRYYLDFSG